MPDAQTRLQIKLLRSSEVTGGLLEETMLLKEHGLTSQASKFLSSGSGSPNALPGLYNLDGCRARAVEEQGSLTSFWLSIPLWLRASSWKLSCLSFHFQRPALERFAKSAGEPEYRRDVEARSIWLGMVFPCHTRVFKPPRQFLPCSKLSQVGTSPGSGLMLQVSSCPYQVRGAGIWSASGLLGTLSQLLPRLSCQASQGFRFGSV